jgi:hypothetical protein
MMKFELRLHTDSEIAGQIECRPIRKLGIMQYGLLEGIYINLCYRSLATITGVK